VDIKRSIKIVPTKSMVKQYNTEPYLSEPSKGPLKKNVKEEGNDIQGEGLIF